MSEFEKRFPLGSKTVNDCDDFYLYTRNKQLEGFLEALKWARFVELHDIIKEIEKLEQAEEI